MITINKMTKEYCTCQVCGNNCKEDEKLAVFAVNVANKYGQGTELHLCKDCCKELRSLLKFTQINGVKMVSIDDVDK